MPTQPIRIVLADDHEMVLQGLQAMLGHFEEVEIVGTALTAADARTAVSQSLPDILLSDVRLGRDSGLDLVSELSRLHPGVAVVMLTVHDDEHYVFQALRAGAKGYVLKRVDGRELVGHLRRVADGEVVVDPALAGRIALSAARISAGEYWPGANLGLTQRESEILELVVTGLSNKAIAGKLFISEDTVKTHTRSLYRKLEVADRAGATKVALREGLFQ